MAKKKQQQLPPDVEVRADFRRTKTTEPLEAKSPRQAQLIQSIRDNTLTFAYGPAGTGKTYVLAALAAEALLEDRVDRIIITRPVIEAGENMGFLPGTAEEKFAPYFAPFREVLEERLGEGQVRGLIKSKRIECAPLAYMRGRSFKKCFVVLDEAQNTTAKQMKLFLTRLGEGVTVGVNGDLRQKDIYETSGLADAMDRLKGIRKIGFVEFTREDIVRSSIVQAIVDAYES